MRKEPREYKDKRFSRMEKLVRETSVRHTRRGRDLPLKRIDLFALPAITRDDDVCLPKINVQPSGKKILLFSRIQKKDVTKTRHCEKKNERSITCHITLISRRSVKSACDFIFVCL